MKGAKIGGLVLAALLLYVLSIGPVHWYYLHSIPVLSEEELAQFERSSEGSHPPPDPSEIIPRIYAPLNWCRDRSRMLTRVLDWYSARWEPGPREAGR